MLRAMVEGDSPLVGINERHARKVITSLGAKIGLERRISSHDLRATFATAVYDKTMDIRLVQELIGHATSAQTEVYIGVNLDKMREAVVL
jgi:site-specific recombinase XerD